MHKYSLWLLRDGEPPQSLAVGESGVIIDAVIDRERQVARDAARDTAVVPVTLTYRHESHGDDLDLSPCGGD